VSGRYVIHNTAGGLMVKIEITIEEHDNTVGMNYSKVLSGNTNLEEALAAEGYKALRAVQTNSWVSCNSCGYKGAPTVGARQTMDTADGIHIAWRTVQCPSCKTKKDVYD